MTSSLRLDGIQCLRAVAALLVVWAHLKFAAPSTHPLVETALGGIGVDLFFVVSGFVIALTASRSGRDARLFFARRLARVAPLYFLLCLVLLIRLLFQQQLSFQQVWNTFFFLPLWDHNTFTNPIHDYGWTLCFEMWFYLLFCCFMWWVEPENIGKFLFLFFAVGALATSWWYRGSWELPRFLFHPMAMEFGAGCLLFHLKRFLSLRFLVGALVMGAVLGFGAAQRQQLGWHTEVLQHPALGWERAFLWGGFSVCLVIVVLVLEQRQADFAHAPARRSPIVRPLVALGDASYSLYLIQPLAMLATKSLFSGGWMGGLWFCFSAIVGGLALHRFIEKPLSGAARRLVDQRLRPSRAA